MNERMQKRVWTTEMDGLRRSMRISRLQHVRDTYIRQEMEAEGTVVDRIETADVGGEVAQMYPYLESAEEQNEHGMKEYMQQ